jgi:hypothetical protein
MHDGTPSQGILPCGFFIAFYAIKSVPYEYAPFLSVGVA